MVASPTSDSISLREYIDRRFEDLRLLRDQTLISYNVATEKSNDAIEKRFDAVNEFRAALSDQQQNLLTRREYDANHLNLSNRVVALEAFRYEFSGSEKASNRNISLMVTVISVLISVALIIVQVFHFTR